MRVLFLGGPCDGERVASILMGKTLRFPPAAPGSSLDGRYRLAFPWMQNGGEARYLWDPFVAKKWGYNR